MARPIKETPILRGKDAERFYEKMENVKPLPPEEIARIKKNFERFTLKIG